MNHLRKNEYYRQYRKKLDLIKKLNKEKQMKVEQIMQCVKECFDENVSSQLEDFLGSTYSTVTGKEEFFKCLKDKLTEMSLVNSNDHII